MATFPLTGRLLDDTREIGDFIPPEFDQSDESKRRSWDYTCLHVLVGREVVKVRLPKGVHVHDLNKGDTVTLNVAVPAKTTITTDLASIGLAESDVA